MAIFQGTALSRSVRGKLGDNVFLYSRGKNIVRSAAHNDTRPPQRPGARPPKIPPEIPPKWQGMTPEEKRQWDAIKTYYIGVINEQTGTYQLIPKTNVVIGGYLFFVQVNCFLDSADLPLVSVPPARGSSNLIAPVMSLAWDPFTNRVIFSWLLLSPPPAGSRVRCWVYSPSKLFHRQILCTALAADGTVNSIEVATTLGTLIPWSTMFGSKFLGQMDFVTPDGRKSGPSNTEYCIIP